MWRSKTARNDVAKDTAFNSLHYGRFVTGDAHRHRQSALRRVKGIRSKLFSSEEGLFGSRQAK
jgi:hypothetical protein